jgi:hypothetical protein
MSISTKEAFELGFLQRCADEGLTPAQTQLRIKAAEAFIEKRAINPGKYVGALNLAKPPTLLEQAQKYMIDHPATATALAATGIGATGFGAGALARTLQGDFLDPEDVKKQEIINEYRNLAHSARLPQVSHGL